MSKINLLVPPDHSSRNSERWYEFVVYLTRHIGVSVSIDQADQYAEFLNHSAQASLVYAAPTDVARLQAQHRYIPLVSPADHFEEVAVVGIKNAQLKNIKDSKLALVPTQFASKLGVSLLARQGLQAKSIVEHQSWMKVVSALQGGSAEFGLLELSFFNSLNELSRSSLTLLASSKMKAASPCLMVSQTTLSMLPKLTPTLLDMDKNERGVEVLKKLGFTAWSQADQGKVERLVKILKLS